VLRRQQSEHSLDVRRRRRARLLSLLSGEPHVQLVARRVRRDTDESSTWASAVTDLAIVSRLYPLAVSVPTSSATSTAASSSTQRVPSVGSTRASATRCRTPSR
jgi:hypothetical protein